jgi:hypothetical protein
VKYFPALSTTSKNVTAVVSATLSDCNFDGTGQQLNGAYDKITSKAISGGTSQSILGSAPFQLEVNDG